MAMGPAPGTAAFVGLPLVFILVLCAAAVWHVDALSRFTPAVVAAAVRAGRRVVGRGSGGWSRGPLAGAPPRDGLSHRHVRGDGLHAGAAALSEPAAVPIPTLALTAGQDRTWSTVKVRERPVTRTDTVNPQVPGPNTA